MNYKFVTIFVLFVGAVRAQPASPTRAQAVSIPQGQYFPFVLRSTAAKGEKAEFRKTPVTVASFFLDRTLVSNEEFRKFVKTHPGWRRSKVPPIFADSHYLEDWKSDVELRGAADRLRPVTRVSWFAAKAYCESVGKTLPTTDQWEYVLEDQGRHKASVRQKILAWYSLPNTAALGEVGSGRANGFGVNDMVGLVWEWTLDFNSFLAADELREGEDKDAGFFCGGGSLGKLDPSDYAAFMRYSFRASLKASYTTANLGFRCAKEKP